MSNRKFFVCGMDCPCFSSTGIWRLANINGTDYRVYGKGKCGVNFVCAVWQYRKPNGCSDTLDSSQPIDFLSALYAMCGGDRFCKTRARQQICNNYGVCTMCSCMDLCISSQISGNDDFVNSCVWYAGF